MVMENWKKAAIKESHNFMTNFRDYDYSFLFFDDGFKVWTVDYFDSDIKKSLIRFAKKYKMKIEKIDNSEWELTKIKRGKK